VTSDGGPPRWDQPSRRRRPGKEEGNAGHAQGHGRPGRRPDDGDGDGDGEPADQAAGLPPGAPIPPASDASGGSTSGSRRHRGPPRAKLALLTWAGAYAVILGVLGVGGPALAGWPLALMLSGLMVAAMTGSSCR
jgi:hypothetical protein